MEVFEVMQLNRCRTFDTKFTEAILVRSPGNIVGVPCFKDAPVATESPTECPAARYVIHQDRNVGGEPHNSLIVAADVLVRDVSKNVLIRLAVFSTSILVEVLHCVLFSTFHLTTLNYLISQVVSLVFHVRLIFF